jgi:hypothetical protein
MQDIDTQLKRLKSPNKNTRFDACETLRVSPDITEEALDALRLATHDPDRLVAEAATTAIAVHMNSAATAPVSLAVEENVGFWGSPWKKLLAVGLLCLVALLLSMMLTPGGAPLGFYFPALWIIVLSSHDYVEASWMYPGWAAYLVIALLVVVVGDRHTSKALYFGLAFLLLVNLLGWIWWM